MSKSNYWKNIAFPDDVVDLRSVGSDGIIIPQGTTAERPVSPINGTMRFNTTTQHTETYIDGTGWVSDDSSTYAAAAEAARDVAVASVVGYATRDLFKAAISGGLAVSDGTIKSAGGLLYMAQSGATTIADMTGWVPFGVQQPEHYGNVGTGDDAPLFQAALNAGGRIEAHGPAYTWTTTITLPSGADLHLNDVPITTTNALVLDYGASVGATVFGANFTGVHVGTSYMIRADQAVRPVFKGKIANGNSGIDFARCIGALAEFEAYQMRGNGGKLRGSTLSEFHLKRGENISNFGVLLESYDATTHSTNNRVSFDKRVNAANLTNHQLNVATGVGLYDPITGRLGLEGLGIRFENDSNILCGGFAEDTQDNGISITSANNSGGNFYCKNNDHDGLHIYGSNNAISGVYTAGNRQSGVGIGQHTTSGLALNNAVTGVTSSGNTRYGVEFKDDADNNIVIGVCDSNTLGSYGDSSTGENITMAGNEFVSIDPTIEFATDPVDLAVTYTERRGWYRIKDGMMDFSIFMRFTPTWTATGSPSTNEFRIVGPFPSPVLDKPSLIVGDFWGGWKNRAATYTDISARFEFGYSIRVRAGGPTLTTFTFMEDNLTSGADHKIQVNGRVRVA